MRILGGFLYFLASIIAIIVSALEFSFLLLQGWTAGVAGGGGGTSQMGRDLWTQIGKLKTFQAGSFPLPGGEHTAASLHRVWELGWGGWCGIREEIPDSRRIMGEVADERN